VTTFKAAGLQTIDMVLQKSVSSDHRTRFWR